MSGSPYVAVVGPGAATQREAAAAREVGALLAHAGATVVTGGLGGVMAAAAEGASAAGGISVGLLPGDDRSAAAPAHSVALATGLGELRNGLVVRAVDGVIAIGGSWGTLSEIALARRSGLPVVTIGGWQVADADGAAEGLVRAPDPAEAVATLLRALAREENDSGNPPRGS